MKFEIPGVGVVEHTNALITQHLERVFKLQGEFIIEKDAEKTRLEDIPVGGKAVAHFRSGMGKTVETITRVE